MKKIHVTKTFLPPMAEYQKYLDRIWESGQLTNQGPLLLEFEEKIKKFLDITDFHFVANGTMALQIALQGLGIHDGEVITTPFSYVATTSAILWQECDPIFVDIDPKTLCIDASKIEEKITKNTKAILAVHVFGNPCEIEKIEDIARRHQLKVIYDAAHAFGVTYKGKSLLDYGDISICSFHATKLFHTIEGGGVVVCDKSVSDHIELSKRFGHHGDEHRLLGINAKASELQAAMGLTNLPYVPEIIERRKKNSECYDTHLKDYLEKPVQRENTQANYAYYPVIAKSEEELLDLIKKLELADIFPRRYFYPSLNTLPYIESKQSCPVSEDISRRVMCLPLYPELDEVDIKRICEIIKS